MDGGEAMTAGYDPVQFGGSVRPAELRSLVTALADAAVLGDFFTISCGGAGAAWRPAGEAYRHGLRDLIGQTARRLGVSQDRVAGSITQLGYAARLWSPALACALGQGIVPDLQGLQIGAELPVRLRLPRPRGWHVNGSGVLAGLLYQTVVEEHLEPLAAGLDVTIASGLLWGNAASAMAGALGVIVGASPCLAKPARALADLLLTTRRLRGTGHFTGPGLDFRRRSCCLYYRVPGGGMCGDCSLLPGPGP